MITFETAENYLKLWHEKSDTMKEAVHKAFRDDSDLFCPFCFAPLISLQVYESIDRTNYAHERTIYLEVPLESKKTTTFVSGSTFKEAEERARICAEGWRVK